MNKRRVAIVTDSTADLPTGDATSLGVFVVPARFAFSVGAFADGDLSAADFYSRLRVEGEPPRSSGAPEAGFRQAFERALEAADTVLCLVTPFDVSPSFTTASAAMLSMDEGDVKIMNPGVASAGLCALIHTLAERAREGWTREQLLDALDVIEPQCDSLFIPAETRWLEAAGRLPLIQDRIGDIGAGTPVVRVGTRITGVVLAANHDEAITRAVALCGARIDGGSPIIATIAHADAADLATRVSEQVTRRWHPAKTVITELSSTIGAQLGPGAIGIGIAPMAPAERDKHA